MIRSNFNVIGPGLCAIFLATAAMAAPNLARAQDQQCDRDCFSERFAQCRSETFTSSSGLGQVQYEILGATGEGCRLSLTYAENPNPAWVGKPLTFVLDPGQPLEGQLKAAVAACLSGKGGSFQCEGPLLATSGGQSAQGGADIAATHSPCEQTISVSGEPLYPLPRNGKWGYVNRAGDWVIKPRWRQVSDFSEGRAAVDAGHARGSVWGIIDRNGDYVLEPSLQSQSFTTTEDDVAFGENPVKSFSQGCAAVIGASAVDAPYFVTRDGRFWLRDGLPESLAKLDVREFGSFSEDKAWFRVMPEEFSKPTVYGWIDTRGVVVIEPTFEGAGDFVDGLAPAGSDEDNWGYIDTNGELAWPRKWRIYHAYAFSDGMAPAMINDDYEMAYTDGESWVIRDVHFDPPRAVGAGKDRETLESSPLHKAGAFSDGLAPVQSLPGSERSLFYIDTDGHIVLEPGEQFAVCNVWGYHPDIPVSLRGAPEFRHGLARLLVADDGRHCGSASTQDGYIVHDKAHYVYIDTEGQVVLEEPRQPGDDDARPGS